MIQINLLPVREARRAADLRQLGLQLALILLICGGGVGALHAHLGNRIENSQTRIRQMENDIKQFKPQLDKVAAFRKKKAELEQKIDVIDGLDRARSGPVRVLSELAERTPERLWITSLNTEGRTITLRGLSLDNELVALFLRGLSDSEYFTNVDLDSTELGKEKGGLKLVSFSVRAVLVNKKPSAAATAAAEGA